MADTNIDSLVISIQTNTDAAVSGLERLEKSLASMRTALGHGLNASNSVNALNQLNNAINKLNSTKVSDFEKIASGMNKLSNALKKFNVPSGFSSQMNEIVNVFNRVGAIGNTGSFSSLVSALNRLGKIDMSGLNASQVSNDLQMLSSAFASLGNVSNVGGFGQVISALNRLTKVDFGSINASAISGALAQLSTAFQSMGDVTNYGGFNELISALNRLPKTAAKLATVNFDTLTQNLTRLATALNSLSTVSPAAIQAMNAMGAAGGNFRAGLNASGTSAINLWAKLRMAFSAVRMITNALSYCIDLSTEYEEDLNLFTVAMGNYANEAQAYAEKVGELMGIDPADWMRSQGVFNTLITGFGVASDRAAIMSKNLTQLGYDISSFYNIDISEAMTKIQSGVSGELEPLRRLGYDLSQARLTAIALSLGIKKSFTEMTQAEKAQLRYHAIMTQVTQAQGDMARTLQSPSNQLRVLKAQVTQAARAIGNIFIPALNAILPPVITALRAIRALASGIASLFGYSLSEVDYSGLETATSSAEDLDSALGGAGGSAKKLKDALMGFDEINKLPDLNSSGGGGGSSAATVADDWTWTLQEYDFLNGLVESLQGDISWVEEHTSAILAVVGAIGAALVSWKITEGLDVSLTGAYSILDQIRGILGGVLITTIAVAATCLLTDVYFKTEDDGEAATMMAAGVLVDATSAAMVAAIGKKLFPNTKAGKYMAGTALEVLAVTDIFLMAGEIADNGISGKAMLVGVKSVLEAAAGGLIMFGWKGALIAAGVSLVVNLVAGAVAVENNLKKQQIAAAFGDADITGEVDEYVKEHFNIDLTTAINQVQTSLDALNTLETDLKTTVTNVQADIALLVNGMTITADERDAIITSITGENGLVATVQSALDEAKCQLPILLNFAPISGTEVGQEDAEYMNLITSTDELLKKELTTAGEDLAKCIAQGYESGWDSQLMDMVNTTMEKIRVISAVVSGENAGSVQYELDVAMRDLNQESVEAVATRVAELKEDYRQNLVTTRNRELSFLSGRYEAMLYLAKDAQAAGRTDDYNTYMAQATALNAEYQSMFNDTGYVDRMVAAKFGPAEEEIARNYLNIARSLAGDGSLASSLMTQSESSSLKGLDNDRRVLYGDNYRNGKYKISSEDPNLIDEIKSYYTYALDEFFKDYSIPDSIQDTFTLSDMLEPDASEWLYFEEQLLKAGTRVATVYSELGDEAGSSYYKYAMAYYTDAVTAMANQNFGVKSADDFYFKFDDFNMASKYAEQYNFLIERATSLMRDFGLSIDEAYAKAYRDWSINLNIRTTFDETAKQMFNLKQDNILKWASHGSVNVREYATGGYPKSGSLFWANENGAELVGTIGGKTAVANQQEIGDAIYHYMSDGDGGMDEQKLASAMVGALKAAGVGAVYLDGRQLADSINRETRRTGHSAIKI